MVSGGEVVEVAGRSRWVRYVGQLREELVFGLDQWPGLARPGPA